MDYSNGKIYKIVSDQCELPYIGSTTSSLEGRFDIHKRWYKKWNNNGKKRTTGEYCSSAQILQYDDAKIELVKIYPCNSKKELREYEGTFQQLGINCVNIKKAGRPWKDWHKNVYYPKNKKKILQQQKERYKKAPRREKVECECGKMIERTGLKNHKRKSSQHLLFLENPEAYKKLIARLKNEKIDNPKYKCECGSEIKNQSSVIKTHNKRKHHIKFMNNKLKLHEGMSNIVLISTKTGN
jgi:hypothetical protein